MNPTKMSWHFPRPHSSFRDIKIKADLSYYATKADVKKAKCDDTASFAKKGWFSYL